jgi:hypothetical protein
MVAQLSREIAECVEDTVSPNLSPNPTYITVNRDDYISRYRIMRFGRDSVLKQVARG